MGLHIGGEEGANEGSSDEEDSSDDEITLESLNVGPTSGEGSC